MYSGLNYPDIPTEVALTAEQDELVSWFFATLDMSPSEFEALPLKKQQTRRILAPFWHINKLLLTRTAMPKK